MRSTPLSARGEPMIWLTGGALVVCLVMIIGLVGMIVTHGMTTFWPRPVEQVTLQDGSVFLGIRTAEDDEPARTLYRTGNRDIGREPFRWVSHADIASIETPPGAVMVEREAWSVWFGVPERAVEVIDGEQRVVAEGYEAVMAYYHAEHASARQRRAEVERLMRQDLGRVNREMERQRLRVRSVELDMQRTDRIGSPMPLPAFVGAAAAVLGLLGVGVAVGRRANGHSVSGRWVRVVRLFCFLGAFIGILGCLLHAPWRGATMTEAELASLRDRTAQREVELQAEYDRILATIREKEAFDARQRLIIVEPTEGRFAPARQIEPDNPIQLSQVVRIVDTNAMGTGQKVGVFLSRWWEFLSTRPREANTEGGVFPVIVGTVMLTLLLTITVTPLGVIAALYLREYAPQGIITSTIRIAVNNLAGVPSIVYGVFGLGFFCYTVGAFVDAGPAPEVRLPPVWWWAGLGTTVAAMIMAYACGVWSRPVPGTEPSKAQIVLRRSGWALWTMTLVLAVTLVVRTPYFTGFFEARAADGSPTFGSRGMLWAALTLALLTLPVVIVSTEEAIASVPNSMREGSYGCGASKWQTLRRIVIPGALPGILTGAILAMARGAGEVAPLMLVGAVKLNQDLPVSGEAPYLHLDRSFMHLGFHIYDLGFQSPDSQAARPLVWTTTLLLLAIVLALNLVAIIIRARLRARLTGSTV
ncbi:MAG: ABC transporter permease subunit [Phycisphaerales bacterium]|nr:ABC transporter permease subunit [Phycisphaerales bacterium]